MVVTKFLLCGVYDYDEGVINDKSIIPVKLKENLKNDGFWRRNAFSNAVRYYNTAE